MNTTRATERAEEDIIRLCHSGLDSRALRVAVFERLQRVVPYEAYWCATTDPSTQLFTGAVGAGFESNWIPEYLGNEFLEDDFNKFIDLAQRRRLVSTLYMATEGDLTRSRRYREILGPAGLGNEMRAVLRSGGAIWGAMCLHRLKHFADFSPTDVAFFGRIAPHLAYGLRAALLFDATEAAPAANGPGMLLLTEDHSVIATTPGAELLMDEIGDWSQHSELPLPVYAVVGKLRALESNPGEAASVIPSVRLRTRSGRWLALHASRLSHPASAEQIAVIIEQATPDTIAPFVLQAYALTPREQEVAGLVLKGYSTEDISAQLCISMLTVQQHLKAIFDKVGVRSRRDLVAQIFARSYWPSVAESHGVPTDIWSPS